MGLLAWCPLNGDTKDYSGSGNDATNSGATIDDSGKIGKCYKFTKTGSDGVYLSNRNFTELKDGYSMSLWVNPAGAHQNYNGTFISSGNWNGSCWAFGVSQDNTRIDVLGRGYNKWISYTLPLNTWTHLTCVVKNNISALYANGEFIGQLSVNGSLASDATNTFIGRETYANGYFSFNGKINDVRIYDHALSTKEIKEIAKAKILHYTFDDFQEPTVNLAYGVNLGFANGDRWIRTTSYPEGLSFTPNSVVRRCSTNTYWGLFNSFIPTTPSPYGRTFVISCWYYLESGYNGSVTSTFYGAPNSGDSIYSNIGTTLKNTFSTSTREQWVYGEQVIKITTNAFSYNYLQGWDGGAISDGGHCYVANFQIEEKDHATPFTPSSRSGKIKDISGYNNDAALNLATTPQWVSDSKIGGGAYKFNGVNQWMVVSNSQCKVTDAITVSAWAYRETWNQPTKELIISCTEAAGWQLANNNGQILFLSFANGAYAYAEYPSANMSSGWHLITGTFDGRYAKLYIDGKLVSTIDKGAIYPITYNATNGIMIGAEASASNTTPYGEYWNGKIDDVRIYATALSHQDIEELYKTRASVDNCGKLFAEELIETKNLFDPDLILRRQTELGVSTSSGKMIYTNVDTLALSAASYYKSGAECSVFPTSYFEPNTSYTFCITINSNLQYNNSEVPGGFTIRYSDGTQYTGFVVKTSGVWKQIVYTTPSDKTITDMFVYYYVGNLFYIDIENTWIRKAGQTGLNSNGVFTSSGINECTYRPGMLDYSAWTFATGWSLNGTSAENGRTIHGNPKKNLDMVWVSPSNDIESNTDGGFVSPNVVINNTKKYRFSVWIRRENVGSGSGRAYFGLYGYDSASANNGILTLAGAVNTNPYFASFGYTGYSEASNDKWALLVGYVHPHTYASTAAEPDSGIYSIDGVKLGSFGNFKWSSTAYYAQLRAYLYYSTKTDERMYFYRPRIDLIDGSEPSIQTLLKCAEHPPLVDPNGAYYSQNTFSISDNGQLYSPEFIES